MDRIKAPFFKPSLCVTRLFTIHLVCDGSSVSSAISLMVSAFSWSTCSFLTRAFSSPLTSYLRSLSTFEEVLSKIVYSSDLISSSCSRMDLMSLGFIEKRSSFIGCSALFPQKSQIILQHIASHIVGQPAFLTISSSLEFPKNQ